MSKAVEAAVHSIDPQIALARLRTLDQVKEESLGEDRYTMVLFASFAVVALLLAAVGIYGLMAFAVAQRTNEGGPARRPKSACGWLWGRPGSM